MSAAASWWRALSLREQRLLLIALALAVLILAWLAVVRPLADQLDRAQRRHAAAVALLAEARAAAEGRRSSARDVAPVGVPLEDFVRRTAGEAGFAQARIVAQGPARVRVAIESARPPALFGWVARLELRGIVVESLAARAAADRTVSAELVLGARAR